MRGAVVTRTAQIRTDLQKALSDPRLSEYERDDACRQAHRRIEQIRLEREPKVKRRSPVWGLAAQVFIVTAIALWSLIAPIWRWATGENRDGFYIAITAIGTAAVVYGRIMGAGE